VYPYCSGGLVYQEFYNLKEKPFSLTPDPQFLFLSECYQVAIESLLYGIYQKEGFIVITGDIGTGKTTICRALLERLDKNVKTAVIFNSFLTECELLESILQDLGYPSKGKSKKELIDALNTFLIFRLSQGENVVLLIDEAQNLSVPVLEQIRMLSNLETEKEKMLQIVLLGQSEFNHMLQSPELRQLNQRIAIRHHLVPLTRTETESYIYQRLVLAGAQGSITFSKPALDKIYKFSKGIPRLINLICDRALLGGFVEQTYHIDKQIIKKAKKSLAGEDVRSSYLNVSAFLNRTVPSPIAFLIILFILFAAVILSSPTLKNSIWGSIQNAYSQRFDKANTSVSKIAVDGDFLKMEPLKHSKGVSLEKTR
jgi:general secretion pathway protein A